MFSFITGKKGKEEKVQEPEPKPPTFFEIKESEFCIDSDKLEKNVKAEDINLVKLWENLYELNENKCNTPDTCLHYYYSYRERHNMFSSFELIMVNDNGAYDGPWFFVSISLNGINILHQKHWPCARGKNGKTIDRSEYQSYNLEQFYPHLKFLCDYVEDALAEKKELDINSRRDSILKTLNELECKNDGN